MRSSLAKYQPRRVWDDHEIEEHARRAWVWKGVLLVKPDAMRNEFERQFLINIGNKLYGRRNGPTRS